MTSPDIKRADVAPVESFLAYVIADAKKHMIESIAKNIHISTVLRVVHFPR